MGHLRSRLQFWRGMHSHWIFKAAAAVWFVLTIVSTFLPFLPPHWSQEFYALNYLPKWHWYVWVIGFLFIAAVSMFEGGHRQVEVLQKERYEIENSKPKIMLDEPGAIHVLPDVSQRYGGVVAGPVPFLLVRFVNKPRNPNPSAKANDVRAKISYYGLPGNTHLLTGREVVGERPTFFNRPIEIQVSPVSCNLRDR